MTTTNVKIGLEAVDMVFSEPGTGRVTQALADVTFSVQSGEFVCLLGPSGCGKSTVLNLIAGFLPPTHGQVQANGAEVVAPGPERGVVFQDANLFPWLTVWKNVTYGPRMRGVAKSVYEPRAREQIAQVGLGGFEEHLPLELSGGMQQRVAIARVLVNEADVLLMDEPFGALDAQTRMIMQELVLQLWEGERKTVLFITHDIEEAILLADRILIMSARPGRIKRVVNVELPRPRGYETTTSTAFTELKGEVLALIREESLQAVAQGF